MIKHPSLRAATLALALLLTANTASAACINRFVSRTERPHQIVTLLTGKLTFQDAQELASAIKARQSPPIEWVGDTGTVVARQFGDIKVVRPMPVGCDDKTSGVVMIVSFATTVAPSKKMIVRFNPQTTVTFDQQAN
jgi:hypothetical protein